MGRKYALAAAGICAGMVNGLFGGGGGMVLVPLLTLAEDLEESEIFPSSIAIMAPLCLVSLFTTADTKGLKLPLALPYLLGGALGAIPAGLWGQRIPRKWLHRLLGILILWGGFRYLW